MSKIVVMRDFRTLSFLISVICAFVFSLCSCKPEPIEDSTEYLPDFNPILFMRVEDWSVKMYVSKFVPGCKVKLYLSEMDYQANINCIDSAVTGEDGTIKFKLDTLVYYYRCEIGCMNNDLFKHTTYFKLRPHQYTWMPAAISGSGEVILKNNAGISFNIYSIFSTDTTYKGTLLAGDISKSFTVPANANSIKLVPIGPDSISPRYYELNLVCNQIRSIDIN